MRTATGIPTTEPGCDIHGFRRHVDIAKRIHIRAQPHKRVKAVLFFLYRKEEQHRLHTGPVDTGRLMHAGRQALA